MIDLIAYLTVRFLNKVLGFVPISVSLWVGRRIGSVIFMVNKKRRLIAYSNLKAAFAREKSPGELKAITKRVYQNMTQTFFEVLNLTKVNRKFVDKYVEVVNMDRIRNAAKSGRGAILLTAHFGDWELSSLVSSVEGYPIMVLAREQKMKRLNELLNRLRESNGCRVIRKGMATKNMLRALHGNNIVGILSDQDAGRKGMFVNFFGRPTSCHSGPFEIANRTGSIILPNFIVRTGGPYHKLFLEEYIDLQKAGSSGDNIKDGLQNFVTLLESYIRKYPDQWLWLHKRWKSTPTRTVLILSDGKAGHINQSLAIAEHIRKARVQQGYRPEDTLIKVIEVRFRSAFHRQLLNISSIFATWRCHGSMRCMKFCLDRGAYDELMKSHSEFVVSCGSSLAAANIYMSIENCAKNIVVMKPSGQVGLGKFDLAVIPMHDNPGRAPNVVATKLAPNMIDRNSLRSIGDRLGKRIGISDAGSVGLFIGGDNPEFSITENIVNETISNILSFCRKAGTPLLVTTARRTSTRTEEIVKKRLFGDLSCKLLVVANEDNPEGTVAGMLALSKVAVVSGESISMVSEAVSSGRRVIVFMPEKKASGLTKHERMLSLLEKDELVVIAKADSLLSALERVWRMDGSPEPVQDPDKIFDAVRRLV